MSPRAILLALIMCPGLEPSSLRKLIRHCGSPQAVWEAPPETWRQACHMQTGTMQRLDAWRNQGPRADYEERLRDRGIQFLLPQDKAFPSGLLDLTDAPLWLFAAGTSKFTVDGLQIAMVGTRRASSYGLEAATWIADIFASHGCDIVSGMANGIDTAAHQAALAAGGSTFAFLASGVNVCYPPANRTLYEHILRAGSVYSEYAPGSMVTRYRFPERNRLIAAVSKAVVLVQAGEKSGALKTVDEALELGRDIYVVPGPITSTHFRGSHRLLQQGANILVDPHDCLTSFGIHTTKAVPKTEPPQRWRLLYEAMTDACNASQLSHRLQMQMGVVYAGLLALELDGWIERLPGGLYRRASSHPQGDCTSGLQSNSLW